MGVTSAIVLFAVIWFCTFLIVIPFGLQTQGDVGEIVEGTHAGAPHQHNLKKKAWITTGIAFGIWLIIFVIVTTGAISVRDFDFFNRMGPPQG